MIGVDSSSGIKSYISLSSNPSEVFFWDWAIRSRLGCLGLFLNVAPPSIEDECRRGVSWTLVAEPAWILCCADDRPKRLEDGLLDSAALVGIEDGTSSVSSIEVARETFLAFFSSSDFAWSAFLMITESVARVWAEGGFDRVDAMSPGANAPLIVYSCAIGVLLPALLVLDITRPSLSLLPSVTRSENCGENISFFCAGEVMGAGRGTCWTGTEGVTLERFGRGILLIFHSWSYRHLEDGYCRQWYVRGEFLSNVDEFDASRCSG